MSNPHSLACVPEAIPRNFVCATSTGGIELISGMGTPNTSAYSAAVFSISLATSPT